MKKITVKYKTKAETLKNLLVSFDMLMYYQCIYLQPKIGKKSK